MKFKYICDKEEIENFEIKRFLKNKDNIYLILKDKIIYFKVPFIYKDQNDEDVHLSRDLLEYEITWNDEKVDKQLGLIEYVRANRKLTFEMYKHDEKSVKLFNIDLNSKNLEFEDNSVIYKKMNETIIEKINSKNFIFIFKSNDKKYNFYYENNNLIILMNRNGMKLSISYSYEYEVIYAVYYEETISRLKDDKLELNTLFEIDNELNVYLTSFTFKNSTIEIQNKITLNSNDFFGCFKEFSKFADLKGIFYDKKSDNFLVFINNYYFKSKDLMQNNFELPENYLKDAKRFKFSRDYTLMQSYTFENKKTKWLKILDDEENFFMPYNRLFRLETNNKEELILKDDDQMNDQYLELIKICEWQTLKVLNCFYCFTKFDYYVLDNANKSNFKMNPKERFKISEIFENTKLNFENQEIEFIFNYKTDVNIFLTRTNYLYIDKENFDVDSNCRLNFTDYDEIEWNKNLIFFNFNDDLNSRSYSMFDYLNMTLAFITMSLLFFITYFLTFRSKNMMNKEIKSNVLTNKYDDRTTTQQTVRLSDEYKTVTDSKSSKTNEFSGKLILDFNQIKRKTEDKLKNDSKEVTYLEDLERFRRAPDKINMTSGGEKTRKSSENVPYIEDNNLK